MKYIYLALCMICTATIQAQVPTFGLVAWYPFNNNANDTSGNNNDFEAAYNNGGIQYVAGASQQGVHMSSGANCDILQKQMVPGMTNQDFTISVWLHPTDTNPGTPVTLMVGRNSVTNFPTFSIEHFMNNPQDHTISFYVYYDFTYTNYQVINLDVSDNSNEWHHYIFSFNAGDSLYTYLDGNLLSSSTLAATSDTLNDATSRYHLGSTATYCNISTPMDELVVYNRSITSAEAADLFTTGLTAIENQTKNNLPVYPNPANDVIQIGWNNTMAAGQGQITSADGKTVYNFTGQPSSIQIASYPPGLYFIRIWQNGQMYSSKFIKQ